MVQKTGRAQKSIVESGGEAPFVSDFFPYLLAQAHSLLTRHVTAFAAAENSSRNEFRVLVTLVDNNDLSLGRLAEVMQVKQPTLSRIIDKLVDSSLVERTVSSDDRRSVRIRLSRSGRREVKPLLRRARTLNNKIISSLGPEDSKNLKRILDRIIENEKSAG